MHRKYSIKINVFLPLNYNNSIFLEPATEQAMFSTSMKPSGASGIDDVLHSYLQVILYLCYTINSFNLCIK